jgi:hypothetical protein
LSDLDNRFFAALKRVHPPEQNARFVRAVHAEQKAEHERRSILKILMFGQNTDP